VSALYVEGWSYDFFFKYWIRFISDFVDEVNIFSVALLHIRIKCELSTLGQFV